MEREKLFMYFEKRHSPKREMLSRIPLGVQPESLWQELLNARKSKSTSLPLYSPKGMPYWYVTTEKMILASEKIVETLFEYETEFDPYEGPSTVSNLEEVFYTSFVEGAQITMHEAMKFLSEERQPKDIEEQLIANNRAAGGFAAKHLGGTVDEPFLRELNALFTDGMEGGGEYRLTENTDYISPGGEKHAFIKPSMLSDRVKDLCAFLDLPEIHPLIKAAAAQGYILVLRPFAEGNERLGRILSSMVLHRCGYGFFGEVSLSALIARKSYAYYEAAENTLREENGGDFTYFIEYFLELLSRAVDERRYRLMQRNELRLRREAELARQPLAENNTEPDIDEHSGKSESDEKAGDDSNIKAQLQECLHSKGALTRKLAGLLLNMLENGQKAFTVADIRNGCAAAPNQAQGLIKRFKGMGLIESCEEQSGAYTVYRIKEASPRRLGPNDEADGDYSEAFYNQLNILSDPANSCRDKRLATVCEAVFKKES